jgi:hypothetical protein
LAGTRRRVSPRRHRVTGRGRPPGQRGTPHTSLGRSGTHHVFDWH